MINFVTNCMDCPLLNRDGQYGDGCNHPKGKEWIEGDRWQDIFPTCPLKANPITIKFKEVK